MRNLFKLAVFIISYSAFQTAHAEVLQVNEGGQLTGANKVVGLTKAATPFNPRNPSQAHKRHIASKSTVKRLYIQQRYKDRLNKVYRNDCPRAQPHH